MDYNKIEEGRYLHFQFQTTNKKEYIKKFLYYDASLFYKEKRKIIPNEYIEKIKKLPEKSIDIIIPDIFDIEKVEEMKKYFV